MYEIPTLSVCACMDRCVYVCVCVYMCVCAVYTDVHIVCPHITVSYPTRIICISHNNSDDVCTELLPVKSLICSDHTLVEEQVIVQVSK